MKLIILDRDGVINRDLGTYVTCPDEFEFIDGALAALAALKRAGFTLAIATNQAGIARGRYTHEQLAAIHAKMLAAIRAGGGDIDRIVYCPSYDNAHPWRKPNAGMLTEILTGYNIMGKDAVFIGDATRDMQAGEAANCHLIMVENAHGRADYDKLSATLKSQVTSVKDLSHAVEQLVKPEKSLCY